MRRFVLGTAGHVDHGKTTLVQALTGVDTDRLPEEKRRGITIELGFARWDVADDLHVSVIDVPGHRRFVHTMIAGAVGIELVLLVVAGDEGVMPQTREHVAACELLGIRRAVVAVTKVDRVGDELATLAGEEARELLGDRFETDVVLCSARTGQGIDDLRAAVARALRALGPRPVAPRARLSVDRVFSVKGAGTVVTGTLVEGKLAIGMPLIVAGETGSHETIARALHVHDHLVDAAEAPTRLAINLAGLTRDEVSRGAVLTDDSSIVATRLIDVTVRVGARFKPGSQASVYIGTAHTAARVDPLRAMEAATPGEGEEDVVAGGEIVARLRLHDPLVAIGGDRFVLRGSDVDGPAGAVLGGGVVLDARAPRTRPRAKRRAVLAALESGDATAAVRALVAEVSPRPLNVATLRSRFPIAARDIEKAADALMSRGELAKVKAQTFMRRSELLDLAARARDLVAEHHKAAPLDRGLGRETLRQQLAAIVGSDAAEEAIRVAASPQASLAGEPLVVEGDIARLRTFGVAPVGGAVGGALDVATQAVIEAGVRGMSENALREVTDASSKEVRAILAKLVRDGIAIHTADLWFAKTSIDDLRRRVIAHLAREKRLTIADFKALSGLGRKQAIPLLEMFDRESVTRREGDDRLPGRASSS